MAVDRKKKLASASRPIPLVRSMPTDTQTLFADGLVIQHAADVFIFSFLKTEYPLVDKPEEYAKLKEVEQRCISQVVVSVEQMARNINVLNKNFKKFLLKQSPENREYFNKIAELPLTEKEKKQAAEAE